MKRVPALACTVLLLSSLALGEEAAQGPPASPEAPSSADALPKAARLEPSSPVAEVNGRPITYWKYTFAARAVLGGLRGGGKHAEVGLDSRQIRDEVMAAAVRRELFYQEAMRSPPADLEAQTEKALADAKSRIGSEEDYQAMLTDQSLSEAAFKALIAEDVAIAAFETRLADGMKVTEDECRTYFETNRAREFQRPERVDLSHILVSRGADEKADAESREQAGRVRQRIADGEDFAAVAREVSQDPMSRDAGGRLGPRTRDELGPDVAPTCFGLKEGEVSAPVRSRFGYHLFLSHGVQPPREVGYEEARPGIEALVRERKMAKILDKKAEELAASSTIKILLAHEAKH